MSDLTAHQRIPVAAGETHDVIADFLGVVDFKNGDRLKAGSTPTVAIDQGTAGNVTISGEAVNATKLEIQPTGTQPRTANPQEAVTFRAAFAATLADTVYRAKITANVVNKAGSDVGPKVRWVIFTVNTGATS